MSTEQQFAAWLIFGLIALLLFAGGQWSAIWSVIGSGSSTGDGTTDIKKGTVAGPLRNDVGVNKKTGAPGIGAGYHGA
jgi:hypothetical protein